MTTGNRVKWTGASEYVLYRHFATKFFPERVRSRHLDAIDIIQAAENPSWTLTDAVISARRAGIQAIGCHSFLNYRNRIATMDYIPDQLRNLLQTTQGALMLDLNRGDLHIAPAARPLGRDRESEALPFP